MTEAEIEETIAAFGEATRRAIEAGFDGVEIHGANTYLLQQFFSPHANRREDRWGDSIEKRMTFPLAIVEVVTATAAKHAKAPFAVGYRLSPEEVEEPGITISDTLHLIDALTSTKLDYLHISTMSYAGGSLRNSDDTTPRALLIQNLVGHKIPIIGVGSIHNPEEVTTVLNTGIPLVALGRELLMEPDWLTMVKEGKEHDIRTTLSKQAQAELVIPDPMWQGLITRKGWLPVVE
jgi:NADH:flavin oxidoreductases, Old Yellow Enzyme family